MPTPCQRGRQQRRQLWFWPLALFFSNSGGLRRGFMGRQVGQAVGMAREGSARVLEAVEAARLGQG